jgi:hypothetical protein
MDMPQDSAVFAAEVKDGEARLSVSAPLPVHEVAGGAIRVRRRSAAIEVGGWW